MNNELWCIYLAGPDDLVAMPSKSVAEAVARNFNAVWDRYGAERGHDVHAVAHVEPWMHGKEAHTKDLREHFHEYADLVLDEDASLFKPAQAAYAIESEVTALRERLAGLEGQLEGSRLANREPYIEQLEERRAAAEADAAYFRGVLNNIRDSTFRNSVTLRGMADDALARKPTKEG